MGILHRVLQKIVLLPILCVLTSSYRSAPKETNTPTVSLSQQEQLTSLEKQFHQKYNPSAQLSKGLFLQGDVFYWIAKEEGLAYALIAQNSLGTPSSDYQIQQPIFQWNFGYRAAVGYNFPQSRWDLGVYWTYFFTHARNRDPLFSSESIIPIWSNPNFVFSTIRATEAEAHWQLNYQQWDLSLGSRFYVSKRLILRPFIGPSWLFIQQHYDLEYERTLMVAAKDRIQMKNFFNGVGLNVGCDLEFQFMHGWGIFGRANTALYYGSFHLQRKETFSPLGTSSTFVPTIKHPLHVGAPAAALALGFSWAKSFVKHHYSLYFKLLWEQLIFLNQNQMIRFANPNQNVFHSAPIIQQGNLFLQGGTASLQLGF